MKVRYLIMLSLSLLASAFCFNLLELVYFWKFLPVFIKISGKIF